MAEVPPIQAGQARTALHAIVADDEYGPAALSNPQMMTNLLRDYLPDAPLAKSLLIAAAEEGVADRLRDNAVPGADMSAMIRAIEASFRAHRGLTEDASTWVVRELSLALGLSAGEDAAGSSQGAVTPVSDMPATVASQTRADLPGPPTVMATAPLPTAGLPSLARSPGMSGGSARRWLPIVLLVIGVVSLILGVIYFAAPGVLPHFFFRSHEAIRKAHPIRGGVALGIGALALIGGWLTRRSRRG